MNKIYTGVGSRKTPRDIESYMCSVAKRMAELGWTLRTGGADGADDAFYTGATRAKGPVELFLPWERFNGFAVDNVPSCVRIYERPTPEAQDALPNYLDSEHYKRLGRAPRLLHSRNVHQVLGYSLNAPSSLVLCWAPVGEDKMPKGGTATAIKIGWRNDIVVFNLAVARAKETFEHFMRENK